MTNVTSGNHKCYFKKLQYKIGSLSADRLWHICKISSFALKAMHIVKKVSYRGKINRFLPWWVWIDLGPTQPSAIF